MAELTSTIYAESLLDVAIEAKKVEAVRDEMNELDKLFAENPDVYSFYTSPMVNREEKKKALKGIFAKKLSPITMNLLLVLLDKRRAMEFKGIVKQYNKLVSELNNEVAGTVYLAKPCKDAVLKKLEKKLSAVTGKNLKLSVKIDPSIIGGIKVKIGDSVLDNTVAAKLRDMKGTIDNIIL